MAGAYRRRAASFDAAGADRAADLVQQRLRSRNFLVPGLLAVIMTLIGALLTAMVMAREWERGTMEALHGDAGDDARIILGKLMPYFFLGMGGLALSVAMARLAVRCSAARFALGSVGMLGVVSAHRTGDGTAYFDRCQGQFVAGQIAIISTFLPAFLLSGFIFDIGSMPAIVQVITHVIAARYFVAILQTVFLAGNMWCVILPNALALPC